MAPADDHWPSLIRGLREGNRQIVQQFCDQYGALLHPLADKHLAGPLRRRVGPEDVALSACRTFLRRAQAGEFQLADSAALWKILCVLTLTKVREQARFHRRRKRSIDQEVRLGFSGDSAAGVPDLLDPGTEPADA